MLLIVWKISKTYVQTVRWILAFIVISFKFLATKSTMFLVVVFVLAILSSVQAADSGEFVSRAEFEERLSALEAQKSQSMYTFQR